MTPPTIAPTITMAAMPHFTSLRAAGRAGARGRAESTSAGVVVSSIVPRLLRRDAALLACAGNNPAIGRRSVRLTEHERGLDDVAGPVAIPHHCINTAARSRTGTAHRSSGRCG